MTEMDTPIFRGYKHLEFFQVLATKFRGYNSTFQWMKHFPQISKGYKRLQLTHICFQGFYCLHFSCCWGPRALSN